jgi:hypothetical protein
MDKMKKIEYVVTLKVTDKNNPEIYVESTLPFITDNSVLGVHAEIREKIRIMNIDNQTNDNKKYMGVIANTFEKSVKYLDYLIKYNNISDNEIKTIIKDSETYCVELVNGTILEVITNDVATKKHSYDVLYAHEDVSYSRIEDFVSYNTLYLADGGSVSSAKLIYFN